MSKKQNAWGLGHVNFTAPRGPYVRMPSEVPTLLPPLDDEETPDYEGSPELFDPQQWEEEMRQWRLRQRDRARENKRRGGLGMCSGIMWNEEI